MQITVTMDPSRSHRLVPVINNCQEKYDTNM